MKSTTIIWIALRNVGDAQDLGESHNDSVQGCILWMAQKLANLSMAGRIVIGMGRTQEDALRGIQVKLAGKSAINEDMKSLLDSVFDGSMTVDQAAGAGSQILGMTAERVAGDDYVA